MSYNGLHSGLYARVCDYAELLDEVLIGLKAHTSSPNDEKRQKLAHLLLGTPSSAPSNLSAQFFQIFLQSEHDIDAKELSEIGQALSSTDVRANVIERLEALALTLENERAGMLAKMRGHG